MIEKQRLREGYTTGTCAAGAAKGAALGLLNGYIPDYVEIKTPIDRIVKLKIDKKQVSDNFAECCIQKDAGDDPDVTNGALVYCRLLRLDNNDNIKQYNKEITSPNSQIVITGGEGIGVVTKPGLQIGVGQAAINPVPRQMIHDAIFDIFGKGEYYLKAIISVPDGEKIAERTFNRRLGICGGISIIGTTGFVRPMSEESIKTSLKCELDVAKALGFKTVILVPGNLAETAVKNSFYLKDEQVVLMSNFVGFMLKAAHNSGFKEIILAGHPGKLAKLIRNDFNTHSSKAKPANDIIVDIIEKERFKESEINIIKESTTVDGIIQEIRKINKLYVFNYIAQKIEISASNFLKNKKRIGVVLFDMSKQIVGLSKNAKEWKKSLG